MKCATSGSQTLSELVEQALAPLRVALGQIEGLAEDQFQDRNPGFKQAFLARARALLSLEPQSAPRFSEQRVLVAIRPGLLQIDTCRWLRGWGLEVQTASDCPSAYRAALQSNRLGLVLLDDLLEGFQGNGSIQSIRQAGGAPVLVLSEVQAPGADGWWPQPQESAALLKLVDHFLNSTPKATRLNGDLGRQHPLKILIAEDLALNQKLIGLLLSRLGYPADAASNGYEVMLKVEKEEYDLILMDLNMPGMNGLEAARRVRLLKPLEAGGPRLVAMSANLPNGTPQGSGFEEFLAKPVQLDSLQSVLRNCPSRGLQADAQSALPVLDPTILENLRRLGDQEFLESLIDDAAQELPQMLGLLMDCWERGNCSQVMQMAHAIKGSASTLGAVRVARLAAEIEEQGKSGRLSGSPLRALETALEEAFLALQRPASSFIEGAARHGG